ncbi:hypothetical protein HPP92_023180 [Vanilla planifolia]|uniref:Uncharacterized protein n=1 Tax=Vanilla planifolia TaxID=51239 RepID=A0A835PYY5_VANPL|nr:hypothetical protein HPP92_023500 [Vanilla planifolia]KAG0460052.1 hypothetical protein HPP92_023180 [Vanilla planifolia]
MEEIVVLLDAIDTSKGGGMIPDEQLPDSYFDAAFSPEAHGKGKRDWPAIH